MTIDNLALLTSDGTKFSRNHRIIKREYLQTRDNDVTRYPKLSRAKKCAIQKHKVEYLQAKMSELLLCCLSDPCYESANELDFSSASMPSVVGSYLPLFEAACCLIDALSWCVKGTWRANASMPE